MGGLEKKKVNGGDAGTRWQGWVGPRGGRQDRDGTWGVCLSPALVPPGYRNDCKRDGVQPWEGGLRMGKEGRTSPVKSRKEPWSRAVRELVTKHSFIPKADLAEGQLFTEREINIT